MATKKCTKCGETKPTSAFSPKPEGVRFTSWCMACRAVAAKARRASNPELAREIHRRSRAKRSAEFHYERARTQHLRVKYGISPDEYAAMHEAQAGLCAICGKPEKSVDSRRGGVRKLAVDHCHATGKIRQLLCLKCNAAIGHFADDVDRVRRALAYLEKHAD